MKCILKIYDEDFGIKSIPFNNPRIRYGARGIITNKEGKIALLNKTLKQEYKLIGGGVKESEDPIKAFKREAKEETGCTIEVDDYLGIAKEIKSLDNFQQISYIYVAHVTSQDEPHFTEKEKNEGSRVIWADLDEAIDLIKNCKNKIVGSKYENVYHSRFIVERDYKILCYYKNYYGI